MLKGFLLVGAGGALGAMARFGVYQILKTYFQSLSLVIGTIFANLLGCFAIGLFMGSFLQKGSQPESIRLFLAVGLLGGFTTFSTFGWESLSFIKMGQINFALINVTVSILGGLLLSYLGYQLSAS